MNRSYCISIKNIISLMLLFSFLQSANAFAEAEVSLGDGLSLKTLTIDDIPLYCVESGKGGLSCNWEAYNTHKLMKTGKEKASDIGERLKQSWDAFNKQLDNQKQ
jgi:hypothetical protein